MNQATLGQGKQLLELLLKHNVSLERVQGLLKSGFITDLLKVADLESIGRLRFQQFIGIALDLEKEFRVTVNWDRPLESKGDEIMGLGFNHFDEMITTVNFPNPAGWSGTSQEQFRFHNFGRKISIHGARVELLNASLTTCHPQVLCDWIISNYSLLLPHKADNLKIWLPCHSYSSRNHDRAVDWVVCLDGHNNYFGLQSKVEAEFCEDTALFPVSSVVS